MTWLGGRGRMGTAHVSTGGNGAGGGRAGGRAGGRGVHDGGLVPGEPAAIRRRGGGPGRAGCAAADPRARSALPDRVRHAPDGAAHLPRGARGRSPLPCAAEAGTGLGPGVPRGTDDPYRAVAQRLGAVDTVGLAGQMWAMMVLRFRDAIPGARQTLATSALRALRIRKTPAEVAALAEAGAAIDRVHASVPQWLRPGRTERAAAADIASAIAAQGHARIDFVIVGSGPNAAKPHHEPAGRVLSAGDAVVVDIGGTMPSGYCSDCTRTYALGAAPPEMAAYYAVLAEAQEAACAAVRPGIRAEAVDAVARDMIAAAGYGEHFTHRTGHGIGLETHEDPYIVAGNTEELQEGMAFSVEPGIYPGPHGARIEDIVVCTADGYRRLNKASRDLIVVAA